MKSKLFGVFFFACHLSFGQNFPKEYFLLRHNAESLFYAKAYKEAASKINLLIKLTGIDDLNEDHLFAASAWALASYPDSAFYHLEIMANNGKYVDYDISLSPNFNSLHNDKRWQNFVNSIKKFDLPLLCSHTSFPPPIPTVFTVDPKSNYLKSDAFGGYLNNLDNVVSVSTHAYNLRILRKDNGDLSKRSLILDLNHPLINTGAKTQGIIIDNTASFHVFYKLDTTIKPWVVYNFREMPIGSTVTSPRTELYIHINGNLNCLQLGFWGRGDCNEPDGKAGHNGGTGTTSVQVTRNSESEYTIEAREGSVGRLWDVSNVPRTIDKGLFKTGFLIHLKYQ